MAQMAFKRKVNKGGIIDANGSIFQFLLASFFAAIFVPFGAGSRQLSGHPDNNRIGGYDKLSGPKAERKKFGREVTRCWPGF